ncbi:MAG TPA: hypothetical protein VGK73_38765 [Polyangiaceae bacterium]
MSARHSSPAWPLPVEEVSTPARAKALPRQRLHQRPDPDLEGLSPKERELRKLWAKVEMMTLFKRWQVALGFVLSNRQIAQRWLGDRQKEGTIRCWRDTEDTDRAPRADDLDRLEKLVIKAEGEAAR